MNTDFYGLEVEFSKEQVLIRNSLRTFIQQEINPQINDWAQKGIFPREYAKKLAEYGVFGITVPKTYGAWGETYLTYGMLMQELEACDSALRSFESVQNSLVMYPILAFGSEEQKQKYLPLLTQGEMVGCFGLTEPDHGSNPSGMTTHFKEANGGYILNGSKMWITNAPIADIAIVWAKNNENQICGLLVEKGAKGFTTPSIEKKWSLRASYTGELVFDDVFVPKENLLPLANGLGAAMKCLDQARFGISWGAVGAAISCYETVLLYANQRKQFDKTLSSFQLTQKKLAEMLTSITQAQLINFHLAKLKERNQATTAQISMAKRANVEMALTVARESRQIMGAAGITGLYPIMRHIMNLESVITYEGTHDIHLLILGAEITGVKAFS